MVSIHHLHNLNHWALLVSAVMIWLIGAVWYSPILFAKPWVAMIGPPKEGSSSKTMIAGMVSSFICDLVLSFILWHVVEWSGASDWSTGALVGLVCWAGFIAAVALPQGIYESRPFKLFAINTGYWLVAMVASGVLLAVWK
jgi:hypothetical protein